MGRPGTFKHGLPTKNASFMGNIVLILILLIHWKIRIYLSALRYSYYFKGTDYIACGPILGRIQGGASVSIAKLLYFSGLAKVFGVHIFS